jgi:hypothetical protein
MKGKICGAVHVERWESVVRCTLPPGHTGRHGWELDKGEPSTKREKLKLSGPIIVPVRPFDPANLPLPLLDQLNAPGSDELAIRYILDGLQTRNVQGTEVSDHPMAPTFGVPPQEGEVRSYFENHHGERFVASATPGRLLVTTDDTDWEEYVVAAPDYAQLVSWLEQPGWIPPPELGLMILNAEERVWLLSVCMACARNR